MTPLISAILNFKAHYYRKTWFQKTYNHFNNKRVFTRRAKLRRLSLLKQVGFKFVSETSI